MKLVRPHIPVDARLKVIARQLQESGRLFDVLTVVALTMTPSARLAYLLKCKFGDERFHLDHEPPLCLRDIIDAEAGLYSPDANDPSCLIYRTAEEHRVKTFIRGDGAQRSDVAKRRRKLKQERAQEPERKVVPFAPRRWPPKGSRPLRGRAR